MLTFGTKAETLKKLENCIDLTLASVLPQVCFTVTDWIKSSSECLELIDKLRMEKAVIVRSSCLNEDNFEESAAGKYVSILNCKSQESIYNSIEEVIKSYDGNVDNQVLIQPMLDSVKLSGVAFTRDPNTDGNYYVINYDETGSTESVTSGKENNSKLCYIYKESHDYPDDLKKLVECLSQLEKIFAIDKLDVEFAFDQDGILYILQVRPLCYTNVNNELEDECQKKALMRIKDKIKAESKAKPFLYGSKTLYGVMPDWNPAEMIGIRPRPLALSLYREIITDSIWAYQRDNYGYRNLRSFPLMVSFCGLPYIDVRVSFNSFIPKGITDELSEKLVNYYISRLEQYPEMHDKVEFEIVFSCFTFDLQERTDILFDYGFTKCEVEELSNALRSLTNQIVNSPNGYWKKDYQKIYYLEDRFDIITNSNLNDIEKIYWLLEDCKRYGTLPFAGLARAGFIAVQLLKSMVQVRIISESEYQDFMNEVKTISTEMEKDYAELSRRAFIHKYGHLRPGTYDIMSKRYDEEPDLYFDWEGNKEYESNCEKKFRLSIEQLRMLADKMQEWGIEGNVLSLFDFIKTAIEGREFSKFIFTKNLSKVLELIKCIGSKYGFSCEELSYLNIHDIQELYSSTDDVKDVFQKSIEEGRHMYRITEKIVLPPLITSEKDVFCFFYPQTEPNYITLGQVVGEIVVGNTLETVADFLEGKILLIESADPGYDWIFSHNISGFITKYGGANSHMAIRAGEKGIPAVIGVGEQMYKKLLDAKKIKIDAAGKKVMILK